MEEMADVADYQPVVRTKFGPDPDAVRAAAEVLVAAKRPVIHAGQGVHWAEAYDELKELVEQGAPSNSTNSLSSS